MINSAFLECHYAEFAFNGKEYSLPQDMLNYAIASMQVAIFVFFHSTMSADRLMYHSSSEKNVK